MGLPVQCIYLICCVGRYILKSTRRSHRNEDGETRLADKGYWVVAVTGHVVADTSVSI